MAEDRPAQIVHCGYLQKKGKRMGWVKRWCELDDKGDLHQRQAESDEARKLMMSMRVGDASVKASSKTQFTITTKEKAATLRAANGADGDAWLEALARHLGADRVDLTELTEPESKAAAEPQSRAALLKTMKEEGLMEESMAKIKVMNQSDGKDLKQDRYLPLAAAPAALKETWRAVKAAALAAAQDEPAKLELVEDMWALRHAPLLGHSIDELLYAFCMWARDDDEAKGVNVDKAMRRLTSYAEFMVIEGPAFQEPPLTEESISGVYRRLGFGLQSDCTDMAGRPMLLISFPHMRITEAEARADLGETGNLDAKEMLRFVAYYMTTAMFDPEVQQHGLCLLEDMAFAGFGTMLSFKRIFQKDSAIKAKVNQLSMGTAPVKMKRIVLFNSPWWIRAMLFFMYPFMSSKMRGRIKTCSTANELCEEIGGAEKLPRGFGPGTGAADWNSFKCRICPNVQRAPPREEVAAAAKPAGGAGEVAAAAGPGDAAVVATSAAAGGGAEKEEKSRPAAETPAG